jgi:hypothetical protein
MLPLRVVALVSAILLAACASPLPMGTRCEIGRSQPCACIGGGTGAQECGPSGIYNACVCIGPDASNGDAPGLDAQGDARTDAPVDAPSGTDGVAAHDAPAADTPPVDAAHDASADTSEDGPTDAPVDATPGCPKGTTSCGGACVDTMSSSLHCGACGRACSLTNAIPECRAGSCAVASCNAGFADCDMNPTNGCENVGACGGAPTAGLVAYYPFDGNANDVANGANGTATSLTYVADRFGMAGRAARFVATTFTSGTSVVVPSNDRLPIGAAPRTLSLWLHGRPNMFLSSARFRSVVGYGTRVTGQRFCINTTTPMGTAPDLPFLGGQNLDVLGSVDTLGAWRHLVATYDGATGVLYINGAENARGTRALSTVGQVLYIGRDLAIEQQYYDGMLDDVRIYNRTLTAAEVQSLYHERGW